MLNYTHEWVNLLIRWLHITSGIAWIGASFYFNWLENHLERGKTDRSGVGGTLWAIHGGGFYFLKKYEVAPPELPESLHWFKWEAYWTWISGFALLVVAYYLNARTMMIDPELAALSQTTAIVIAITSIFGAWFVYDGLARSSLERYPRILGLLLFVLFVLLSWGLSHCFNGRSAYIHVGAAIGTCMVGNVFRIIIPAQRALVDAMVQKKPRDAALGRKALMRSRHNNYMTLPLLFIMISNHFPHTYGHALNWLILAGISAVGIMVRYYFNIRHLQRSSVWLIALCSIIMIGIALMSAPARVESISDFSQAATSHKIPFHQVQGIILRRCAVCHAQIPTQAGFISPPLGVRLETEAHIRMHINDISRVAIQTRIMPPGNLTGMTEEERRMLTLWIEQQRGR